MLYFLIFIVVAVIIISALSEIHRLSNQLNLLNQEVQNIKKTINGSRNESDLISIPKEPLLYEVAKWGVEKKKISISAIQRHFSIGYSRAALIIKRLCELGICSDVCENSKYRTMLIDNDELTAMFCRGIFRE